VEQLHDRSSTPQRDAMARSSGVRARCSRAGATSPRGSASSIGHQHRGPRASSDVVMARRSDKRGPPAADILTEVLGRRTTSLVASACALELLLAAVGCADGDPGASSTAGRDRSTAEDGVIEEASGVPLAEPTPGLAQQCLGAARFLGFAVPCPTSLPLVGGEPVDCSGDCIGIAGERGTEVLGFFLNIEGYDGNPGAPETVRHLIPG
jgi:hypothetical protein